MCLEKNEIIKAVRKHNLVKCATLWLQVPAQLYSILKGCIVTLFRKEKRCFFGNIKLCYKVKAKCKINQLNVVCIKMNF